MASFPFHANDFVRLFQEAIRRYHVLDSVEQPIPSDALSQTFESKLFLKAWIDTVQWHLEDLIRDPSIEPSKALDIKRWIDRSNQERTDLVEWLDQYLFDELGLEMHMKNDVPVNTESPGWAIDRLSILQLKRYHMALQVEESASIEVEQPMWQTKLNRLNLQNEWLCLAIDQLLQELTEGKRRTIPFQQMKMYNDERTNPFLKITRPV
jgi:hypothetical protein